MYFRDAKVGDRVWSMKWGWGDIRKINYEYSTVDYQSFKNNLLYKFNWDGRENSEDTSPTLFWDEVKIVPPPKPKSKVKKVIGGWTCYYKPCGKDGEDKWPPRFSSVWDDRRSVANFIINNGYILLGEPIYIHHEYEVEE
jgi:hypothetical protein